MGILATHGLVFCAREFGHLKLALIFCQRNTVMLSDYWSKYFYVRTNCFISDCHEQMQSSSSFIHGSGGQINGIFVFRLVIFLILHSSSRKQILSISPPTAC